MEGLNAFKILCIHTQTKQKLLKKNDGPKCKKHKPPRKIYDEHFLTISNMNVNLRRISKQERELKFLGQLR